MSVILNYAALVLLKIHILIAVQGNLNPRGCPGLLRRGVEAA
jgi:hypothetical protein